MSKMKTLEDLLEHQIQDLHSAEQQIIDALPAMVKKASHDTLQQALKKHLEETKKQKERLDQISKKLSIKAEGKKCKAISGIIAEAEEFMSESATPDVMDAGIIANAQRVEHYEISGYGTAKHYAQRLGHTEVAELLNQTLEEEKDADEKLNDLAIERINADAMN